jgi:transposase-like protein
MPKKISKPVVVPPNPEVDAKPTRRTFTAAYKLKILEEADGCSEGEIGALLRREGLYSSHLTTWRRQRGEGAIQALGKKRGRKAKPRDKEKEQLVKENARLRRKLEQAEKIIEIQKKVSALLAESESNDESGESE